MKKFSAILLALVLVLAMSTSALAATITAPEDSVYTYKAYKIFDVTKNASGSGYAYSIADGSEWLSAVQTLTSYVTLTKSADGSAYTVAWVEGADAEQFASALKNSISGKTVTATITKDAAQTVEDGYYLITSTAGTALILATTNITITEKNGEPDLDKAVDGKKMTTANKGDVLEFTIKVTIPATAAGEIVVHDKMTGLEYNSMTSVDGITVTTGTGLGDDCAVHFTLSADYVAAHLGETVTIAYTAKVTADTAKNEAYLVNNDFESTPNTNEVYSTDIEIVKHVSGNETTKLAGAKFVLKNGDDKFYKVAENGDVSWVDAQADAYEVMTDANGAAKFENLADGTYYLIETEAPAGYNMLTDPVEVKVSAQTTDEDGNTIRQMSVTAKVANSTGSELPLTGGMGTTIFYMVGGLMVTLAVVVLVAKKKVGATK